ncbi:MAG: succinate dehydrogenase assembly factor 2 [Proteobacteria bacterium]|nr:succinate dehydrogenase assembly factor 2 [Pseudomonadota bacterium]
MTEKSLTESEKNRIYWRSRRGMLELELRLLPFVENRFHTLSEQDQRAYAALLEHEDWEIFDWLQDREQVPDPAIRRVIGLIKSP